MAPGALRLDLFAPGLKLAGCASLNPLPPPPGAAGTLLIAHPGLIDPNFRKTVIFISNWDAAEGAFGLVLNRPAGRTVGELLPERSDLGALSSVPVFLGGPVSRDQLVFASFHWQSESETYECRHHVSLGEAEELVTQGQSVVRAFIGYAGWAKGQLEAELAQQAWLLKPPARETVETAEAERAWPELLGSFGPKFRLIAEAPDDPSAKLVARQQPAVLQLRAKALRKGPVRKVLRIDQPHRWLRAPRSRSHQRSAASASAGASRIGTMLPCISG